MLTKILNNGLVDRVDTIPTIMRALNGTWGSTTEKNNEEINLGRPILTYVYSGTILYNNRASPALAIILYVDGTYDIKKIVGEVDLGKEISMAIMVGKN